MAGDAHYAEALALGAALAAKGLAVCSGGYGGVMEAVSRGAKESGGRTLAVTAEFFKAHANRWVEEEIRVRTWQERLFELVERGQGYVACPGGTGTLVELAVVWEMLNKRRHEAKTPGGAGRFLATDHRARARSGNGSCVALGRARRTAGAQGKLSRGCGRLPCRAFSDACHASQRFRARSVPALNFPQATGLQSLYLSARHRVALRRRITRIRPVEGNRQPRGDMRAGAAGDSGACAASGRGSTGSGVSSFAGSHRVFARGIGNWLWRAG